LQLNHWMNFLKELDKSYAIMSVNI